MNGNGTNGSSTQDDRANAETSQAHIEQQGIKRTKRKKASRACFHCQKAHLTCDDSRPCQRCIKRGLDASCQDGIRKKAKYLQDIDNEKIQEAAHSTSAVALTSEQTDSPVPISYQVDSVPQVASLGAVHEGTINLAAMSRPTKRLIGIQDNGFGMIGDNLLFDYPLLSSYDFDSKAANMEYSMLSNMLGNATTPGTDYGHSPDTNSFTSPGMNNIQRSMPSRQHTITPDQASVASESSWTQIPASGTSASTLKHTIPQSQNIVAYHNASQVATSHNTPTVESSVAPKSPMTSTPGAALSQSGRQSGQYVDPHGQRPTPVARRPHSESRDGPGSIYKAIVKPFSYTNGYHLLNTYLRSRFEKEDLLRIARAIVGYRPSFIALTKTLKEEDLTFMEVCFQRTLLEYEKFVGYSGTPTIIWRRTGQIELVGKEFCLLTQWSREQLLSKQTFIVELMDDSSVVEYFEKFSAHAFGDTSSVQTTCVLMTPQKRAVPCAFCFTIKRDVFDIPMMIVGNFLPVL